MIKTKQLFILILVLGFSQSAKAGWAPDQPPGGGTNKDIRICYVTNHEDTGNDGSLRSKVEAGFENGSSYACKNEIVLTKDVALSKPLVLNGTTLSSNFTLRADYPTAIDLGNITLPSDGCAVKINFSPNPGTLTVKNIIFRNAKDGMALCVNGSSGIYDSIQLKDNKKIGMVINSQGNKVTNSIIEGNKEIGIKLTSEESNEITHNTYKNNGAHLETTQKAISIKPLLTAKALSSGPTDYELRVTVPKSVNRIEIYRVSTGSSEDVSTVNRTVDNVNNQYSVKQIFTDVMATEAFFALAFVNKMTSAPSDIRELQHNGSGTSGTGSGSNDCVTTCQDNPSPPGVKVKILNCIVGEGVGDDCQDSDCDGIPDNVEDDNHDGKVDPTDHDCVYEEGETDLSDSDTDKDGIIDGAEDKSHDGLWDEGVETNPREIDTDVDNLPDGCEDETKEGVTDFNETDPKLKDSDMDGLDDNIEIGLDPGVKMNPKLCKVILRSGANTTDPTNDDSDNDGLLDGAEDSTGNGIWDWGETNPKNEDTDNDGLKDGSEDELCPLDPTSGCEGGCLAGDNLCIPNCIPNQIPPADLDFDKDGLKNRVEDANHDCRLDPGESNPWEKDTDHDDEPDGAEKKMGTDPQNPDTDDDQIRDGIEDLNHDGVNDSNECDPREKDTDGDSILDDKEDFNKNGKQDILNLSALTIFNPACNMELKCNDSDTDRDGIKDGDEDKSGNGYQDLGETCGTDDDSDGDGAPDNMDPKPVLSDKNDARAVTGLPPKGCALNKDEAAFNGQMSSILLSFAVLAMALLLTNYRLRKIKEK